MSNEKYTIIPATDGEPKKHVYNLLPGVYIEEYDGPYEGQFGAYQFCPVTGGGFSHQAHSLEEAKEWVERQGPIDPAYFAEDAVFARLREQMNRPPCPACGR